MVTLGLKMKKRSLTLWMVCFLLREALSAAFVCTGVDDSWAVNTTLHVTCKTIRDLTSEQPSNTESHVVTEPENNKSLTESPVVTEPENKTSLTESHVVTEPENNKSLTESPVVTEPENKTSLTESHVVTEPENNKSLTGIIVGAMIGGIAGIVIVVAKVLLLRRKHKRKEGQTGNTDPVPDYYNVPGGSVDQLHGTASNSSIQSDYVNTTVDIDTVASNASNMNTYESLALQDLAETDHNYDSIARTEAGIYINTAVSGAS